MRRVLASLAAALALVGGPATDTAVALCAKPPAVTSAAGAAAIRRSSDRIAHGVVDARVPKDAHGSRTYYLKVRRYFRGTGPATLKVTDYGDFDAVSERPGSATAASRRWLKANAGKPAVVFVRPDYGISGTSRRFAGAFATDACGYTAYGRARVARVLPVLRRLFPVTPPRPASAERPASALGSTAAGLLVAAAGFVVARVLARRGTPEAGA